MNIELLYRISSHKQIVEVDDVSTSLDKVSKKVIIFEKELPEANEIKSLLESESFGTVIIIDSFNNQKFLPFDIFAGTESNLRIVKVVDLNVGKGIICLPENYITFYLGQTLQHISKVFQVKIVTLSDRAHRNIYKDESGPKVAEMLTSFFASINQKVQISSTIIPDNKDMLIKEIVDARNIKTDLLITTGGTGVGKRDITVETVKSFLGKEIPGVMEMIRLKYGAENPKALLSCAVAGIMSDTLVFTLPGSPKAVEEYLTEIFQTLNHIFCLMYSIEIH